MAAPRAFVIHWHKTELAEKCDRVRAAGWAVCGSEHEDGERAGRNIRKTEPDAIVVWMARLPSHGRATAGGVRGQAWGRAIPVVFVHGDPEPLAPEKRAKTKDAVPDGAWCTPANLRSTLSDLRPGKASVVGTKGASFSSVDTAAPIRRRATPR